jgi:hypothetical protein
MLRDDTCHWLAADFDGPTAMLDALSYLKAARAVGVPGALEVSRSGTGAHVWVFFEGPVRAETARTLGSGLVREGRVGGRAASVRSAVDGVCPVRHPRGERGDIADGQAVGRELGGRQAVDGAQCDHESLLVDAGIVRFGEGE